MLENSRTKSNITIFQLSGLIRNPSHLCIHQALPLAAHWQPGSLYPWELGEGRPCQAGLGSPFLLSPAASDFYSTIMPDLHNPI